ncbi:DsrE/DsrF/DrsH-like family protein [Thermithiobacillus plumbiphilus]|uniref:DsrE/DsrF/DrsH-like family protein n=1 Tax=Thermithiobacillus plumbiphilus TaxID=1729899 RepID=A0ABU9D408_9PROT
MSTPQDNTPQQIDLGIVMTSGPDTPRRLASPFFLAATAAAEERSVVVYFTGLGTLLLKKGVAEEIYPKPGGKSVAQFMQLARDNGAQFVLCATSMDLFDLTPADVLPDIPAFSVSQALPYLEAANKLLSF